jgi:hypothetical protein
MDIAARLSVLDLCCQTQIEGIWKGHIAGANKADRTEVGYMDLRGEVSLLAQLTYGRQKADTGRGVVAVLSEWREVGCWVSGIGNLCVVVQRLAEYPAAAELAGVIAGGDSRGSRAERSEEVSESQSYLKLSEVVWMEGATAAEVEVVGTCVYYYLPEAGHDARSRIWTNTCVQFGGSFTDWERQGVVQCGTGTSGMWALPRVWRRERFIVQSALVATLDYLDRQQPDRRTDASIQLRRR